MEDKKSDFSMIDFNDLCSIIDDFLSIINDFLSIINDFFYQLSMIFDLETITYIFQEDRVI